MNTNLPTLIKGCRRYLYFLMTLIFAIAAQQTPAFAQTGPIKIAVVDLDRVFTASPKGRELAARLDNFQKQAQAEIEAKAAESRALRQQITDGVNTLTEDKLAEMQKEYEDAQIRIRRLSDDKTREAQKMRAEGLQAIESSVQPVLEQIRVEEGYDLMFNSTPGIVIMAGPRVDITQQVLDRMANN